MKTVAAIKEAVLHLLYPHTCSGCVTDNLTISSSLCSRCISKLPETGFTFKSVNPVEKKFWGRMEIAGATSVYYFSKESLLQHLLYQLKYRGNQKLGIQLGQLMGEVLKQTSSDNFDAIIPLPLFSEKKRQRGYNQSELLCRGISDIIQVPVWDDVMKRTHHTESQTKKRRVERWVNIEGKFELTDPLKLNGKNILLVDDVITTGATMEACGMAMLEDNDVRLSIASLCFAAHY